MFVLTVQLIFQGTPSKDSDSAKEGSRSERTSVFTKRSAQAATLQHKKPTSSVDADIIGGSTLSSQAMLKQEVSTASSKGSTIKTGMLFWPYNNYLSSACYNYLLPHSIMVAMWHFESINKIILT